MAENQEKQKNGILEMIFDVVSVLATACIAVTLAFLFLFRTVGVNGGSMEPTLQTNDRIVLTATYGEPECGDIVVTCQPNESLIYPDLPDVLVKRIIATGGQTIDIDFEKGIVKVDDVVLDEPYINNKTTNNYDFDGPVTVPEGYVFVMGDNRQGSIDSRYSGIGFIKEDYILGKALFRVMPFGQFKIG